MAASSPRAKAAVPMVEAKLATVAKVAIAIDGELQAQHPLTKILSKKQRKLRSNTC